jgi:RNA polymerase sigma factor (sigma-70 family)
VHASRFPTTRRSAIAAARSTDDAERRRALDLIVGGYLGPALAYVRHRWRAAEGDAQDLVQGFFAHALEHESLQRWDPEKARFRTWLRVCLDGYVGNELKRDARLKRGGGITHLSLDDEDAGAREVADGSDPDEWFHREWLRHLFAMALDDLRVRCRERGWIHHEALFERYDLADPDARPTYAALALERGIAVTDVTNHLAAVRREFRSAILARLRELTLDDDDFRREARALMGVET